MAKHFENLADFVLSTPHFTNRLTCEVAIELSDSTTITIHH